MKKKLHILLIAVLVLAGVGFTGIVSTQSSAATVQNMTYENGQWFKGIPYEELGAAISNPAASISADTILFY